MRYFFFLCLLFFGLQAQADTLYVNQNALGLNDGTSWKNAYLYLDDALSAASFQDEVWVAKGDYAPKDGLRESSFNIPSGVKIYGGFNGYETSLSLRLVNQNQTILNGDIGKRNFAEDNCIHVVYVSGTSTGTLIDGFTIKNGYNTIDDVGKNGGGGAIEINNSYLDINQCTMYSNHGYRGGAIHHSRGSQTINITNTELFSNTANSGGGAISANTATFIIQGCKISLNSASSGGAVYTDAGRFTFDRCDISGNATSYGSGGFFSTSSEGGDLKMYNCLVVGNVSNLKGGAIYININNKKKHELFHCCFSGNVAKIDGETSSTVYINEEALFANCIFWGNDTDQDINHTLSFGARTHNCILQKNKLTATDRSVDPKFLEPGLSTFAPFDADNYNYRLAYGSPGFNTGSISYPLPSLFNKDLDNNNRIEHDTIDLGPYEASYDFVQLNLNSNFEEGAVLEGNGRFFKNDTVKVHVRPRTCFTFLHWAIGDSVVSTDTSFSIKLEGDITLKAVLDQKRYFITTSINDSTAGSVTKGDSFFCSSTTMATFLATPKNCYKFLNWTENGIEVSSNREIQFFPTSNRDLQANFEYKRFEAKITIYPAGSGTVTGKRNRDCDSTFSFKARPASGYRFDRWVEGSTTLDIREEYSFRARKNIFITAFFERDLSTSQLDNNQISISPNPATQSTTLYFNTLTNIESISIWNMRGQLISNTPVGSSLLEKRIDLSNITKGLYRVSIITEDNHFNTTLIVTR